MTDLLSEITFCDECPYSGEPNGCNREEGVCKAHESYFDLVEENTTLRERLKKAVELPRVECIITKEWVNRETIGDRMFEWCVLYKKDGYLMVEPCLSKEAAEERLKELQGESA